MSWNRYDFHFEENKILTAQNEIFFSYEHKILAIKQRSTYILILFEPDLKERLTLNNVFSIAEDKGTVWNINALDWVSNDYYVNIHENSGDIFILESKNGLKCQLEARAGEISFVFNGENFLNKKKW